MKLKLVLAFFLILTIKSFSQESKFSVELSYPIPFGENFIEKNYNGIIELGLKYRFFNLELFNVGASLNAGILKNSKDERVQPYDITAYLIQPRIFAELDAESVSKFHPSVGIGYTMMIFNLSGTNSFNLENPESISASQTESGLNLNLGIAYDISNKWFAQVQYDFIKKNVPQGVPDIKFNTNINILKVGLGYRI